MRHKYYWPDENVFNSTRSWLKNGDFRGYNTNRPSSKRKSGLIDAMERLGAVSGCQEFSLGGSDIVRHPLVQRCRCL